MFVDLSWYTSTDNTHHNVPTFQNYIYPTEISTTSPTPQSSSTSTTPESPPSDSPSPLQPKKRYSCPFPNCTKTFSTSGHLSRHNRIHLNLRPYRCTYPGCGMGFTRGDNMRQHLKKHKGEGRTRGRRGGKSVGVKVWDGSEGQ